LDTSKLVTIVVTAVVAVIAKELVQWLWAMFKTLSVISTIRAKIKAIFTKTNRAIIWDILGVLFYGGVLVNFALKNSPPTRLEILLMLGAAFLMIVMSGSLLFHVGKAAVEREHAAKQRESGT
jgi:hypothetical protein